MGIRNAAKAIIINNDKVLVNKCLNTLSDMCYGLPDGAIYYDLPGGGQNQYETLEEAVKRECLEETGYTVSVDRLAAIYEEISMHGGFREQYADYAHKVHFVFLCRVTDRPVQEITEKDLDMLSSEWMNMGEIENILLCPPVLKKNFSTIIHSGALLYFGAERI